MKTPEYIGFMAGNRPKLWKIVLDVLKPHEPPLPEFATKLASMSGVDGVNVTLVEIDRDTETVKVTINGKLDYSVIRATVEEWGGVIHSVDEVVVGRKPIAELLSEG